MKTSDFDFYLPEELIAQHPLEKRDYSKLMVLDKETGKIEHKHFYNVVLYLCHLDPCAVFLKSPVSLVKAEWSLNHLILTAVSSVTYTAAKGINPSS